MQIMKAKTVLHSLNCLTALAGLTALLTASPAQAATRWWDGGTNNIGSDGNGGSSGGSGIWNTTLLNWDQGAALPHTNWVNEAGDSPSFGGTAGTVTLGEDITVGGIININSGTAANPYTIAGGSGPYSLTVSNDARFGAGGYGIITAAIVGGTNSVTKAFGTGTLVLSGPTAFDAATTAVSNGTMVISGSAALGTGNLTLFGGVLGLGNGNFTRSIGTGDNQFQLDGGGFAAFGSNRTVGIGTASWGASPTNRLVGTLILGAADADATVTWLNNLSLAGSTRTIQVDDGSAPVDAIISGQFVANAGGLTKTGDGLLSLTASNLYTGGTTVSGGVLKLDHQNAIPGGVSTNGSSALTLTSSGVVGLTAGSGDFFRYYGSASNGVQWTGSGGFAAYGGTRTAKFTNSAATSINWGTAFIGTGRTLILSHASSDSTIDWQQAISLAGNPRTVRVDDGSADVDAIMSGIIGGGSGGNSPFIKTGNGTLAFTAANSYNGNTTVSNGTLQVGNGGTTGILSANSASIIVATNALLSVNRSTAVSQSAGGGLGNGSAAISGEGGVAHVGTGTLTLSLSNSYSGGTFVSGSNLLVLAHSSAAGTGPIQFNSTSTGASPTFTLSGGVNVTNPIVLDAANGRHSITTSGTGDSTLGGDITINNTATYDIIVQNSIVGTTLTVGGATPNSTTITAPTFARNLSLRGNSSTAGALGILNSQINAPNATVNANNNALVAINSTGNNWAVTSFNGASSFVLGADDALATNSYLNFAATSDGYLDLNGNNQTLSGLTAGNPTNGVYNITNGGGSDSILTLAGLTQDRTFNGSIIDGGAGKRISLVMNSGGFTQTLTGTNAYTGHTTVNGGTLAISVASIATNSTVSVAAGAVLQLDFTETNIVTSFVTNGVPLASGVYSSNNVPAFITGSGSLQVPGTGPVVPTATALTNSYSAGTLSLSWPAGQGWRLEQQTNALSKGLSTNWVDVTPGSASSTNITVDPTKPTTFYRLAYP